MVLFTEFCFECGQSSNCMCGITVFQANNCIWCGGKRTVLMEMKKKKLGKVRELGKPSQCPGPKSTLAYNRYMLLAI